jgi:hypothetical protein
VTTFRRLCLAGAAGFLLMLAGCPQGPGPYEDYVGVNLIEDQAVFGFGVPGRWTTDAAPVYMDFSLEALEAPPAGAPVGAAVYRLEIKNLMPNGDFEATVPPAVPAGWGSVGGAVLDSLEDPTAGYIDGVTMHLACADGTEAIDFDIRAAAADGFLQDNTYLAQFDYRTNKNRVVFEYNNLPNLPLPEGFYTWSANGDVGNTFDGRYEFPPVDIVPTVTVGSPIPDEHHYYFNSLLTSVAHRIEVYVDNFRVIRTNQSYFVRMPIADLETTPPELVAGTYRFSIWLKRDPYVTPDPLYLNRFPSSAVELWLRRTYQTIAGETSTLTAQKAFRDGDDIDLSDGQWHKVHVDLPGHEWQTEGATVSMEVGISPTDETLGAGSMDSGSILIAAPSLEMRPDSY